MSEQHTDEGTTEVRIQVTTDTGLTVTSEASPANPEEVQAMKDEMMIDLVGGWEPGDSGYVSFETADGWTLVPTCRVVTVTVLQSRTHPASVWPEWVDVALKGAAA